MKYVKNRILNIEYRISNPKYRVWFFQHSTFNIRHSTRASRGFTLIETMVALTILLVSVVGPISLIADSLQNIYYARDQIVAVNLAQEGIEVVRHVRDSNILATENVWSPELTNGDYIIDAVILANAGVPEDFASRCSGPCTTTEMNVVVDPATGLYGQDIVGGTATQFSRTVNIVNMGGGNYQRKITSTVKWNTGNKEGTVTAIEYLFEMPAL